MIHRRAFIYVIFLILLTLLVEPQEPQRVVAVSPTSAADTVAIPLPVSRHAPPIYPPLSPSEPDMHYDLSPSHPRPESVEFRFYLPKWTIYRRSVTLWGIHFSTGHAPSGLPSGADASADVLTFPLTPPR